MSLGAADPAEGLVRPWHIQMTGRDPDERHRVATPLELLFDLCFVVAVAEAASELHHDLAAGQLGHGIVSYLIIFFAIWWPWVNFTWFASAYDTDDVLYRLLTFVQIGGVLVVTAGVPSAFETLDFRIAVIGYVIMRIALVGQWLRAVREDPAGRSTAVRFAIGISLVQLGWIVRLAIGGPLGFIAILLLGLVELAIPFWAERSGRPTPWHPGHVAERYGLFTIIVLGEVVLAASTAIQRALAAGALSVPLLGVAMGGLLLVFGLWWAAFKHPAGIGHHRSLLSMLAWGYGHYVVFAAIAALGAGLQVAIDTTHGATAVSPAVVALTVAIPVAVFLCAAWLIHPQSATRPSATPLAVSVLLLVLSALSAPWIGVPLAVVAMGVVLGGLVAVNVRAMQVVPS